MTDQKPTISLAQWCAYLPYGIKVEIDEKEYILTTEHNIAGAVWVSDAMRYNGQPLLRRPHFDIQKILDNEYNSKVDYSRSIDYDYHYNRYYDSDGVIEIEYLPNSIAQALLQNHYDIFNLIPQGLALPIE